MIKGEFFDLLEVVKLVVKLRRFDLNKILVICIISCLYFYNFLVV